MIPFYPGATPLVDAAEVISCLTKPLFSGGKYVELVQAELRRMTGSPGAFLVPSCTSALEMAVRLLGIGKGDEVILPSFNFPAAGNAILGVGATPVFADIDPCTQNLDPRSVVDKITGRTKAVICVHYASVGCDMERLMMVCEAHGLMLIEDAAQAVGARYMGQALGSFGRFGCYSFHATKVFSSGEGGALICGARDLDAAEIYSENGTNRQQFLRGDELVYRWQRYGTSASMSELLACVLLPQLVGAYGIIAKRLLIHDAYSATLARPMHVPDGAEPNGHLYYIMFKNRAERERVRHQLRSAGVQTMTHYEPLHTSPMGERLGYRPEDLPNSLKAGECLLRLPIHENMTPEDAHMVAQIVNRGIGQ